MNDHSKRQQQSNLVKILSTQFAVYLNKQQTLCVLSLFHSFVLTDSELEQKV